MYWKSLLFALAIPMFTLGQWDNYNYNKFKQLYEELPTPGVYRTASGAPGHAYYQQQVDYNMDISLDDANQRIYGEATITYHNNSPDDLDYLWLQLDQNKRASDSKSDLISESRMPQKVSLKNLQQLSYVFDGGFKLEQVTTTGGTPLNYVVNYTMMRVDLPQTLKSGGRYSFKVKWWYNINDRSKIGGRSGFEYFQEDDNYLYTIAQFFPRLAVYNETEGWQNNQFWGRGEFALPFGDYTVNITVPEDHIVGSTGTLSNASSVLTREQRNRFEQAKSSDTPVMIVTPEEAEENLKEQATGTKMWTFKATNVRDFAFAASRRFIWDAMGVPINGKTVMAMSYYPKEGNPLWEQYSTRVVAHTIEVYSKYTIDYPYPVAISVHTDRIGMEYPMICFNGGRPEPDGTYSAGTKHGMISVIIHEVGHNFFPMIINSDERQWTWMDEGLNTFVQFLTEQEWDRAYPSRRGPAHKMVNYMKGDKRFITPIMTNSESIFQFGNNAYGKPATALNILRETVLGRELFDFAFKTYCERWAFKHPTPADLFRTMEDASAVDLDWFWRGWFYSTDHCDIAISDVKWKKMYSGDPVVDGMLKAKAAANENRGVSAMRNDSTIATSIIEKDPTMQDFYNKWERYTPNALDIADYDEQVEVLTAEELALIDTSLNFYEVSFERIGGLVMPVIIEFEFIDGTREYVKIPAEIWNKGQETVTKLFTKEKEVVRISLDPLLETADTDRSNNYWPPKPVPSRFEVFLESTQSDDSPRTNPMSRSLKAAEKE